MNHISLNEAGPYDRHFNDELIKHPWLEPGQHGHLGAGFNLEDANSISLADHGVGARIFGRSALEREMLSLMVCQKIQPRFHAGQHVNYQNIDFYEFQDVDIVLVLFNNLALLHRRRLNGYKLIQPVMCQHKTTGMLRQMAGRPDQVAGQIQWQADAPVGQIKAVVSQGIIVQLATPNMNLARECTGQVFR